MVPSIYLAVDVIREAAFNTQSQKFVNEIQSSDMLAETEIIKSDREYHHRSRLRMLGNSIASVTTEAIRLAMKIYPTPISGL